MKRWKIALSGLLGGFVAALLMTLVMAVLRYVWGLATPSELISDRMAPFIKLNLFSKLINVLHGYSHLKQLGAGGVVFGQLIVGALVGLVYAILAERGRERNPQQSQSRGQDWRARAFLLLAVAGAWFLSLGLFWPVLGTDYKGLPPGKAAVATALGLLVSYAVYGWTLLASYRLMHLELRPGSATGQFSGRRAFFVGAFGVAAAFGLDILFRKFYRLATYSYDGMEYKGPDIQTITPNDKFYVVTKNNVDPNPIKDSWRLEITGMVEHPKTYTLEQLRALPAVEQETTLECISDQIGGGLMSNAIWTGVPLNKLIEAAGPKPGIQEVICRGVDSYTDNLSFGQAMNPHTLVAYEMNGVSLPPRHGFPARVLVPGQVGEKSVKWVTRIELADHNTKEFYERQGWGPDFTLNTHARFDSPKFDKPLFLGKPITLKGVAFAGSRGINQVEISADEGRNWEPAELTYKSSPLAWVFWKYNWRPRQAGEYMLVVRAIDGTGAIQPSKNTPPGPESATGYQRVKARIETPSSAKQDLG